MGLSASEYLLKAWPDKRQKKSSNHSLNAGKEVILGNCGGFLSHSGPDEYMLGSGFKQSNAFTQSLNQAALKYHEQYPEAPNALKNKHIYELITCAM